MDEDDFLMGDEEVIRSTEVNGGHVNESGPSLALNGIPAARKETPSSSNEEPETSASSPSSSHPIYKRPHMPPLQDTDADAMDIEYSHQEVSFPKVEVRIPPPPRFPPLPYSSSKTGLVYDVRMRFHEELEKADDFHPEDPRRIVEIFNEIRDAGLVQGPGEDENDAKDEHCWRIHARHATKGEISLVHTEEHYNFVESLQHKEAAELCQLSKGLDSVYLNRSTFESARLAAGGAIEACRAVVRGDVRNAIAIIRPPGHHAESDQPSGFCIFNNVPIATRVCQNDFPKECRKVLILDWDVHHGNGVQHAFYEDPNTLYISLHVYQDKRFYPMLEDANLNYCGEGPGIGRNVNIPWEDVGMGDAEYIYAFQEVVIPIATEFDPDLIIISAGFDAAEGDVLGGCHVTPACYAHMTHMLMRLAKGKVVVCLEGGYNLRSIARSALAVTRTLMLQPPDRLAEDLGPPLDSAVRTVKQVQLEQSKYWKCMYPRHPTTNPSIANAARLHNIIREWQSLKLRDEQKMLPLTITKTGLSQSFAHNVIATPGFMEEHPLLVIFHEPPSVMNQADPITGEVELHNIWLTDVSKNYIGWAIENGFQVIDVNIPRAEDIEDDEGLHRDTSSVERRAFQTRMLANYLWENYIEPYDSTQIFFMGIGAPNLGLVELLGTNENITDDGRVQHLIGFISDSTVNSIKRATDDNIGAWFYEHSLIFVDKDHNVWDPKRQRKLKKKYGKLKQSEKHTLNDMLQEHMEEVKTLLLAKKRDSEEPTQGLRSPPLASGTYAHGQSRPTTAENSNRGTPGLPPLGLFSAPSPTPRSPRSPVKRPV